jgi:hypothetical protein
MCNIYAAIALTGYSMIEAKKAQQASDAMAEQKYRMDMEEIKDNRKSVMLNSLQNGNAYKQQFLERLSTNNLILAQGGKLDTGTGKALTGADQTTKKQDLNAAALKASNDMMGLSYRSYDARLQLAQSKQESKALRNQAYIKAGMTLSMAASGMENPFGNASKGGSIGKTSMLDFRGGTAGTGGFSPNPITGKFNY